MSALTSKIKSKVKSIDPNVAVSVVTAVALIAITHKAQSGLVNVYRHNCNQRLIVMAQNYDKVTQAVIDRMPPVPTN